MHLDTINQTFEAIGKVSFSSLSVPCVSYRNKPEGKIIQYPLYEVFSDYGTHEAAQVSFLAMLEKSECPLVKAYIQTVQACFVDKNLDELEQFSGDA
jgi:hypothetical protein